MPGDGQQQPKKKQRRGAAEASGGGRGGSAAPDGGQAFASLEEELQALADGCTRLLVSPCGNWEAEGPLPCTVTPPVRALGVQENGTQHVHVLCLVALLLRHCHGAT